jgi:two-component system phosphate regulon response regulator PhoB
MARILVIAPDAAEATLLSATVASGGHTAVLCGTGREAVSAARTELPALVLLDSALPDMSLGEVCGALAAQPETRAIPIVVLSQRGEEIDRILGFELGASDYVVKPYSVRELLLRIAAILRRSRPAPSASETIDLGRLKIDRAAYRVWIDGREIDLTLMELNLLIALCEGRSRVQTRAALLGAVWGIDTDITTRTVDTHVKRLRDKLGPLGEYVETVRGIGYRMGQF